MRKIFKIINLSCLLCLMLTVGYSVAAEDTTGASGDNISSQVEKKIDEIYKPETSGMLTGTPQAIVGKAIKTLMGVVGSVALVMFVYAGYLWMTAGGDPKDVDKSKEIFTWATLGLVVIFIAYAAVDYIISKL